MAIEISRQNVFVVDDDRLIAGSLTQLVQAAEFNAEAFYDASSALLRANNCRPDILITDVNMPGMNGISLANAIRELNPNCKIILITGNPRVRSPEHVHANGLDGFVLLLKPFSPSQLLRLVKSDEG